MANVQFDNNIPKPKILLGDIHDLLEEMGYELKKQDFLYCRYQKGKDVLSFDGLSVLYQLQGENGVSRTQFCVNVHADMDDVSAMLLLQSIGSIDITKNLIYRQFFGTAIKTKILPAIKPLDWFMKGINSFKRSRTQIGLEKEAASV